MYNKKSENQVYNQQLNNSSNKEPIRRGCNNETCFCSGACQEIIGWKDKDKPFKFPKPEEESHFEDIEMGMTCKHIEHEPPSHLYIPQGKRYIHICPGCRTRIVLEPPQITF